MVFAALLRGLFDPQPGRQPKLIGESESIMIERRPQTLLVHLLPMVLALGLVTLSPRAAQNFTSVTFESQDLLEEATVLGQMHFRDDKLRIDGAAGSQSGDYSMVFRGDQDLLWFLMHPQRQYIAMDQHTMEQMSKQIAALLIQEVSQGSSDADPFELPPDYKEEKLTFPR